MKKILIAGASGFIGGTLIQKLLLDPEIEIVALSRREQASDHPRLTWKKCDLFSLKDIRECMVGCETAYYLVHSMIPSAALTQGEFYDFDLILADNFMRAAGENQLKHIIYLSGMMTEREKLSWHLKSRLEVEQALHQFPGKLTTLRAGLVIGKNGSSFTILQKLIERLPLMVCPTWTKTLSQPVALQDIIRVLMVSLYDESVQGKSYDIGGPDVVTYQDLILRTSVILGQKRRVYTFNIIPLALSRLWVSLITGESKDLVYPLVLSLTQPMVVDPARAWPHPKDLCTTLNEALKLALVKSPVKTPPKKIQKYVADEKVVRSVQRLYSPKGKDAEWIANEYFKWLLGIFNPLFNISIEDNQVVFWILSKRFKLLILEKSQERSAPDRQLFYIVGGMLVSKKKSRARLEFRDVLNGKLALVAIHDFYPAMPWFIYVFTQAKIHLLVMRLFNRHIKATH